MYSKNKKTVLRKSKRLKRKKRDRSPSPEPESIFKIDKNCTKPQIIVKISKYKLGKLNRKWDPDYDAREVDDRGKDGIKSLESVVSGIRNKYFCGKTKYYPYIVPHLIKNKKHNKVQKEDSDTRKSTESENQDSTESEVRRSQERECGSPEYASTESESGAEFCPEVSANKEIPRRAHFKKEIIIRQYSAPAETYIPPRNDNDVSSGQVAECSDHLTEKDAKAPSSNMKSVAENGKSDEVVTAKRLCIEGEIQIPSGEEKGNMEVSMTTSASNLPLNDGNKQPYKKVQPELPTDKRASHQPLGKHNLQTAVIPQQCSRVALPLRNNEQSNRKNSPASESSPVETTNLTKGQSRKNQTENNINSSTQNDRTVRYPNIVHQFHTTPKTSSNNGVTTSADITYQKAINVSSRPLENENNSEKVLPASSADIKMNGSYNDPQQISPNLRILHQERIPSHQNHEPPVVHSNVFDDKRIFMPYPDNRLEAQPIASRRLSVAAPEQAKSGSANARRKRKSADSAQPAERPYENNTFRPPTYEEHVRRNPHFMGMYDPHNFSHVPMSSVHPQHPSVNPMQADMYLKAANARNAQINDYLRNVETQLRPIPPQVLHHSMSIPPMSQMMTQQNQMNIPLVPNYMGGYGVNLPQKENQNISTQLGSVNQSPLTELLCQQQMRMPSGVHPGNDTVNIDMRRPQHHTNGHENFAKQIHKPNYPFHPYSVPYRNEIFSNRPANNPEVISTATDNYISNIGNLSQNLNNPVTQSEALHPAVKNAFNTRQLPENNFQNSSNCLPQNLPNSFGCVSTESNQRHHRGPSENSSALKSPGNTDCFSGMNTSGPRSHDDVNSKINSTDSIPNLNGGDSSQKQRGNDFSESESEETLEQPNKNTEDKLKENSDFLSSPPSQVANSIKADEKNVEISFRNICLRSDLQMNKIKWHLVTILDVLTNAKHDSLRQPRHIYDSYDKYWTQEVCYKFQLHVVEIADIVQEFKALSNVVDVCRRRLWQKDANREGSYNSSCLSLQLEEFVRRSRLLLAADIKEKFTDEYLNYCSYFMKKFAEFYQALRVEYAVIQKEEEKLQIFCHHRKESQNGTQIFNADFSNDIKRQNLDYSDKTETRNHKETVAQGPAKCDQDQGVCNRKRIIESTIHNQVESELTKRIRIVENSTPTSPNTNAAGENENNASNVAAYEESEQNLSKREELDNNSSVKNSEASEVSNGTHNNYITIMQCHNAPGLKIQNIVCKCPLNINHITGTCCEHINTCNSKSVEENGMCNEVKDTSTMLTEYEEENLKNKTTNPCGPKVGSTTENIPSISLIEAENLNGKESTSRDINLNLNEENMEEDTTAEAKTGLPSNQNSEEGNSKVDSSETGPLILESATIHQYRNSKAASPSTAGKMVIQSDITKEISNSAVANCVCPCHDCRTFRRKRRQAHKSLLTKKRGPQAVAGGTIVIDSDSEGKTGSDMSCPKRLESLDLHYEQGRFESESRTLNENDLTNNRNDGCRDIQGNKSEETVAEDKIVSALSADILVRTINMRDKNNDSLDIKVFDVVGNSITDARRNIQNIKSEEENDEVQSPSASFAVLGAKRVNIQNRNNDVDVPMPNVVTSIRSTILDNGTSVQEFQKSEIKIITFQNKSTSENYENITSPVVGKENDEEVQHVIVKGNTITDDEIKIAEQDTKTSETKNLQILQDSHASRNPEINMGQINRKQEPLLQNVAQNKDHNLIPANLDDKSSRIDPIVLSKLVDRLTENTLKEDVLAIKTTIDHNRTQDNAIQPIPKGIRLYGDPLNASNEISSTTVLHSCPKVDVNEERKHKSIASNSTPDQDKKILSFQLQQQQQHALIKDNQKNGRQNSSLQTFFAKSGSASEKNEVHRYGFQAIPLQQISVKTNMNQINSNCDDQNNSGQKVLVKLKVTEQSKEVHSSSHPGQYNSIQNVPVKSNIIEQSNVKNVFHLKKELHADPLQKNVMQTNLKQTSQKRIGQNNSVQKVSVESNSSEQNIDVHHENKVRIAALQKYIVKVDLSQTNQKDDGQRNSVPEQLMKSNMNDRNNDKDHEDEVQTVALKQAVVKVNLVQMNQKGDVQRNSMQELLTKSNMNEHYNKVYHEKEVRPVALKQAVVKVNPVQMNLKDDVHTVALQKNIVNAHLSLTNQKEDVQRNSVQPLLMKSNMIKENNEVLHKNEGQTIPLRENIVKASLSKPTQEDDGKNNSMAKVSVKSNINEQKAEFHHKNNVQTVALQQSVIKTYLLQINQKDDVQRNSVPGLLMESKVNEQNNAVDHKNEGQTKLINPKEDIQRNSVQDFLTKSNMIEQNNEVLHKNEVQAVQLHENIVKTKLSKTDQEDDGQNNSVQELFMKSNMNEQNNEVDHEKEMLAVALQQGVVKTIQINQKDDVQKKSVQELLVKANMKEQNNQVHSSNEVHAIPLQKNIVKPNMSQIGQRNYSQNNLAQKDVAKPSVIQHNHGFQKIPHRNNEVQAVPLQKITVRTNSNLINQNIKVPNEAMHELLVKSNVKQNNEVQNTQHRNKEVKCVFLRKTVVKTNINQMSQNNDVQNHSMENILGKSNITGQNNEVQNTPCDTNKIIVTPNMSQIEQRNYCQNNLLQRNLAKSSVFEQNYEFQNMSHYSKEVQAVPLQKITAGTKSNQLNKNDKVPNKGKEELFVKSNTKQNNASHITPHCDNEVQGVSLRKTVVKTDMNQMSQNDDDQNQSMQKLFVTSNVTLQNNEVQNTQHHSNEVQTVWLEKIIVTPNVSKIDQANYSQNKLDLAKSSVIAQNNEFETISSLCEIVVKPNIGQVNQKSDGEDNLVQNDVAISSTIEQNNAPLQKITMRPNMNQAKQEDDLLQTLLAKSTITERKTESRSIACHDTEVQVVPLQRSILATNKSPVNHTSYGHRKSLQEILAKLSDTEQNNDVQNSPHHNEEVQAVPLQQTIIADENQVNQKKDGQNSSLQIALVKPRIVEQNKEVQNNTRQNIQPQDLSLQQGKVRADINQESRVEKPFEKLNTFKYLSINKAENIPVQGVGSNRNCYNRINEQDITTNYKQKSYVENKEEQNIDAIEPTIPKNNVLKKIDSDYTMDNNKVTEASANVENSVSTDAIVKAKVTDDLDVNKQQPFALTSVITSTGSNVKPSHDIRRTLSKQRLQKETLTNLTNKEFGDTINSNSSNEHHDVAEQKGLVKSSIINNQNLENLANQNPTELVDKSKVNKDSNTWIEDNQGIEDGFSQNRPTESNLVQINLKSEETANKITEKTRNTHSNQSFDMLVDNSFAKQYYKITDILSKPKATVQSGNIFEEYIVRRNMLMLEHNYALSNKNIKGTEDTPKSIEIKQIENNTAATGNTIEKPQYEKENLEEGEGIKKETKNVENKEMRHRETTTGNIIAKPKYKNVIVKQVLDTRKSTRNVENGEVQYNSITMTEKSQYEEKNTKQMKDTTNNTGTENRNTCSDQAAVGNIIINPQYEKNKQIHKCTVTNEEAETESNYLDDEEGFVTHEMDKPQANFSSFLEDVEDNKSEDSSPRIQPSIFPQLLKLQTKEELTPEEFVQEVNQLKQMDFLDDFRKFYMYQAKQQIVGGHRPVSFTVFLEFFNNGRLAESYHTFLQEEGPAKTNSFNVKPFCNAPESIKQRINFNYQ